MEFKFTGVYIDLLRSLQLHVICCDDFITLCRVGAHNAFLSEFGGGVMDLVYDSSFLPYMACLVFFSDE